MDFFVLTPDVAYVFLVCSVLLTLFALITPGTGLLEAGALFFFLLSGYAIYSLTINVWALIVLLVSLFFFMLAIKKSVVRKLYLGLSIIGLIIGSAYFFRGDSWAPSVNIWLVIFVSLIMGGFIWLATIKVMETLGKPTLYPTRAAHLVGHEGIAKSEIGDEGSALIAGELWAVRSKVPIAKGTAVRVVNHSGFILDVEAIDE